MVGGGVAVKRGSLVRFGYRNPVAEKIAAVINSADELVGADQQTHVLVYSINSENAL